MSDHDPTDPTRPDRPLPREGTADEPTSVLRTPADEPTVAVPTPVDRPPSGTRTTTTETLPPRPPPRGGVSTGAAVAGAIAALLIGLLLGFLLFDSDDDDGTATVDDTVADDGRVDALEAERDDLAAQVMERDGEIESLRAQLDDVTSERDALQSELDDAGEQPTTVPAPDVVGGTVDDARAVADDNGWTFEEREATGAPGDAEPGTVVDQSPEPGTPMVEGSVLLVDVVPEPDDQ